MPSDKQHFYFSFRFVFFIRFDLDCSFHFVGLLLCQINNAIPGGAMPVDVCLTKTPSVCFICLLLLLLLLVLRWRVDDDFVSQRIFDNTHVCQAACSQLPCSNIIIGWNAQNRVSKIIVLFYFCSLLFFDRLCVFCFVKSCSKCVRFADGVQAPGYCDANGSVIRLSQFVLVELCCFVICFDLYLFLQFVCRRMCDKHCAALRLNFDARYNNRHEELDGWKKYTFLRHTQRLRMCCRNRAIRNVARYFPFALIHMHDMVFLVDVLLRQQSACLPGSDVATIASFNDIWYEM
jgi:hypothetical protein